MNLFDKNRNDLSKYFYDLSKVLLLSYVAVPVFQEKFSWKFGLAGSFVTVLLLAIGMLLKKG